MTPAARALDVATAVYELHADQIGTHYDQCWKYHAGCLASLIKHILEEES